MAIEAKISLLLLLLCVISRAVFGLECYCDRKPTQDPNCGFRDTGSSCNNPNAICYTAHIKRPDLDLLVIAGCLDKILNQNWVEMCGGDLDSETTRIQCCDTPLCNEPFFNGPFPTSAPVTTPSTNSTTDSIDPMGSGSGFFPTTQLPTTTDDDVTTSSPGVNTATSPTLRPTTQPPPTKDTTSPSVDAKPSPIAVLPSGGPGLTFEVVVVAVTVSVSVVLLVLVAVAILVVVTHLRWARKDKNTEENSQTELRPSVPQKHKLKGQQVAASTAQVHPQVHPQVVHKPAAVPGQTITMMPPLESIICWDNDGKGS